MDGTVWRRSGVFVFVLAVATGLTHAFLGTLPHVAGADVFRAALVFVTGAWLAWGCALALVGLVLRAGKPPTVQPTGRAIVVMPVCNEDPAATMARIGAVRASIAETTHAGLFEIAVISDSDPDVAQQEERRLSALLTSQAGVPLWYRRRLERTGRKAGNIADFLRFSGGGYRYAVVLDSDSLMEGATLVEMIRRMDAAPTLGLLQTVPLVLGAQTRFGRAMQFASHLTSPLQARGLAALQGRAGPYWGHNAILRIEAFAAHCGLGQLSGAPPLGGDVLSHDYVEAALLVRGGWDVRIDPDLGGSYEEGPEDIVAHARRDRRWCQGNLQHARLIGLPGLSGWSRFSFILNVTTYAMAAVWALFLLASLLRPLAVDDAPKATFPTGYEALILVVVVLLILPRLAALCDALGQKRWHGKTRLVAGTFAELLFSALIAPILLAWQLRAVLEVLTGRDAGWPAHHRPDRAMTLRQAWFAAGWITSVGIAGLALTIAAALGSLYFVLPVFVPMIAAPLIVAWSSASAGTAVFAVPQERAPPAIVLRRDALVSG